MSNLKIKGDHAMSDSTEAKGSFIFDQDSKRFHRFRIEGENGIVGNIYIPKDCKELPEKIVLDHNRKE